MDKREHGWLEVHERGSEGNFGGSEDGRWELGRLWVEGEIGAEEGV